MKKYVFDSSALISYLDGEENAQKIAEVFEEINEKNFPAYLSVINLGEIYYHFLRTSGIKTAQLVLDTIKNLPLNIIEADIEQTLISAQLKAFNKMSYADCFAAALTEFQKAILITSDKEFKQLEKNIKIKWV